MKKGEKTKTRGNERQKLSPNYLFVSVFFSVGRNTQKKSPEEEAMKLNKDSLRHKIRQR
jgi:hypothetical protein